MRCGAADVHRQLFIAAVTYIPLIDWLTQREVVLDGHFLFQLGLNALVGAGAALFFRRMTRKIIQNPLTEQVMKRVGRLPGQHSTV